MNCNGSYSAGRLWYEMPLKLSLFTLQLLLQYGADPEPCEQIATCVPGWPLHHSIVYAHFPCFLELVKAGAIPCLTTLPCQVNEKVVARLSIPHAILKYAR